MTTVGPSFQKRARAIYGPMFNMLLSQFNGMDFPKNPRSCNQIMAPTICEILQNTNRNAFKERNL